MSAIFGILRFDGAVVDRRDVARCLGTMQHRMPDGRRVWCDEAIGLGHGMLRVTHEDAFEYQPLSDPHAPVTLVADLRLDNRDELAATLGIDTASLARLPDSTLLLAAYHHWGEDCARHLLGDFAFAIWDARNAKLVLGRDHMGQRHVFYHQGTDFFAFATEIKALWALPDVPRVLSDVRIGKILMRDMGQAPGATPFDGIFGVPGGNTLTIAANGDARPSIYWEPVADPAHLDQSEDYYIAAYRRILGEAVECRIRRAAAAPGLILSGGYDSAAIAGLAGPVMSAAGRKLVAVASTMPVDYEGTIRHAGRWVELCARDMPHLTLHRMTLQDLDPLRDFEKDCLELDGPVGSYQFALAEILRELAKRGARMIMDGHGGDYTLNPRGQNALARLLTRGAWGRFIRELKPYMTGSGYTPWQTIKNEIILPLLPKAVRQWLRCLKHGPTTPWSDRPINPGFARTLIAQGAVDPANLRGPLRATLDMRAQLLGVLRRPKNEAAPYGAINAGLSGLSLTRPFHDKRVVELALAIPQDLYMKNGRSRYLACAALRDVYPVEFQSRWRLNDDMVPDFQRMIKKIEPSILEDIGRMEQSRSVSRYVDFAKIRRLLAARGPDDHNSGWEQESQMALAGYLAARYIEWFRRDNA